MRLHRLSKPQIAFAWALIALAGVAAGWRGFASARASTLERVIEEAQRCAAAFDPVNVRLLTGTRADAGGPVYLEIMQRLARLRAVGPEVRSVQLVRFLPETARVCVLADSAQPEARDARTPGDDLPAMAQSAGFQSVVSTDRPAAEGPVSDATNSWITGYALAFARPATSTSPAAKDLLVLELDASNWPRDVWGAAFTRAFYVWMLLGLPLTAVLVLRRELEQRDAIRNLSEAMEQSHSALMIVDLGSRIEYANRGLCQQIGYSRRELLGRPWREFQVADTPPERLADLVSTVRAGKTWEGEWFNRRKDGTTYPVRGIITPVKNSDGVLACFVAVFEDMTEIKRQQTELGEARDLAEAADRAKGQFLATMSHEIRTPLNGIVGFTNLLGGTSLSAEQREYVDTIRSGSEALIELTSEILDFARIESGKLKLDLLAWDPRECVEDALDLFAKSAAEKNVELLHVFDPALPAAIFTDGGRLRQVLINLVSNSLKFTDAGEVEVRVALATPPGAKNNSSVVLEFSVRDTGHGIAAEHQGQLFRPFTQLDTSLTRKHGGAGLGLAISKNLVHLLGGAITCTSQAGRGATFAFTIHAAVATPAGNLPDLGGVRVALVARPGALRRELAHLLTQWRAPLTEGDDLAALPPAGWDTALVVVDEALATELTKPGATPPGRYAQRAVALVPVTLGTEMRHALRPHFRLLINKPLHHAALFAALSGQRTVAPVVSNSSSPFGFSVLIVEDNPVNQRFMQRALSRLGCTWHAVEDGRAALEELGRSALNYDLVLLDIHMPEIDGLTVLSRMRAGAAGRHAQKLWVAIVTADVRPEQRATAIAKGVNEFLTKPLQLSELEAALQRYRATRDEARRNA